MGQSSTSSASRNQDCSLGRPVKRRSSDGRSIGRSSRTSSKKASCSPAVFTRQRVRVGGRQVAAVLEGGTHRADAHDHVVTVEVGVDAVKDVAGVDLDPSDLVGRAVERKHAERAP
jgi:hypothetical protein